MARGNTDATAARSYINRMTIRQNNWTLGTFCETYCRMVTNHHMLEDRSVFPHICGAATQQLAPVIDRLEAEHETIARPARARRPARSWASSRRRMTASTR